MSQSFKKYEANHVWVGENRCYRVGDSIYPGVTTILSATKSANSQYALSRWREKVGEAEAERIKNEACDRGTKVHAQIENHLQEIKSDCPVEVIGFWDSIRPVLSNVSNIKLIEGAVWHPEGFAGSVDCVAEWEGQLSIVDWKTSSKPKKEEWIEDYRQQVAAYCAAVNKLYGTKIQNAVIAIALEDQPAQVFKIPAEEMWELWKAFVLRVRKFKSDQSTISASNIDW